MKHRDYQSMYDEYWSLPDRWGESSFQDAEPICEKILNSCGGAGRFIDVGCGMGVLVKTLIGKGVDAYGIDISARALEGINRYAPGIFAQGSVLNLPYLDNAFETVISTDMLEHLAENDALVALQELCRISSRFVFLVIATRQDRDHKWHLTVKDRAWWEQRCMEAGFRKHPLYLNITSYQSLENEGGEAVILLEKIPKAAADKYLLEALKTERDLHTDMLREPGRRADAHVERYRLASEFIRPGDTVLDVACGLGYGSAVMYDGTLADKVIGIDNSEFAIEYARANYATSNRRLEFRVGDAHHLGFLEDCSIDFFASFETLEHLEKPMDFLAEAHRVLTPAGRMALSVPNRWLDEQGDNPSRDHLHIYDWKELLRQVRKRFLVEHAYCQVAGGHLRWKDKARLIKEIPITEDEPKDDAEWWILVLMKDPVGADKRRYRESAHPTYSDKPGVNITAFERDYDNPWLVRAIVSIGMRSRNPHILEDIAKRTLEIARPGSADTGAALTVLAYRLLEGDSITDDQRQEMIKRIVQYQDKADDNPHGIRWRISSLYVAARLAMAGGHRRQARELFLRCASLDATGFSPLLATKTVDALFHAGLLALNDNDIALAGECWHGAHLEIQRVLQGDWSGIWGDSRRPAHFALQEVAQLAALGMKSSRGLLRIDQWFIRPGVTWIHTMFNKAAELAYFRRYSTWLQQQVKNKDEAIRNLEKAWQENQYWLKKKDEQINNLLDEKKTLQERLSRKKKQVEELIAKLDDNVSLKDNIKHLIPSKWRKPIKRVLIKLRLWK